MTSGAPSALAPRSASHARIENAASPSLHKAPHSTADDDDLGVQPIHDDQASSRASSTERGEEQTCTNPPYQQMPRGARLAAQRRLMRSRAKRADFASFPLSPDIQHDTLWQVLVATPRRPDMTSTTDSDTAPGPHARWWGDVHVEPGHTTHLRIGPLQLWFSRLPGEWRVASLRSEDALDPLLEPQHGVPTDEIPADAIVERLGTRDDGNTLQISPRLADRAVVSEPELGFRLAREEELTLFVSSPLWIHARPSSPTGALIDTPIFRPSDTWFGPPTREGELCYASRTACHIRLEDCPVRAHRATTAVTVRNSADTELEIERVKLPVHTLELFVDGSGRVWTQDVLLERHASDELARMSRSPSPPAIAQRPDLLATARNVSELNVVMRAFNSFFSR